MLSFVVVVSVAGFAVAQSGGSGRRHSSVSVVAPPTTVPPRCVRPVPVVPRSKVPRDVRAWARGAAVIGHGELWTARAALDVPGYAQQHEWYLKFPWYARPFALPTIHGRRLDGPGTFRAETDAATDSRGTWVVSGLHFSRPGCWEITARLHTSTITFRLRVGKP